MNHKAYFDIEAFLSFFFWTFIIVALGLAILGAFIIEDYGGAQGSHTGFVTAVEHRNNLIFDANLVYFKTDAMSSQEDIYCVNDVYLYNTLQNLSSQKAHVTIYFKNDFIMWKTQCNGGTSIIYDVYGVKEG